MVVLLDDSVLRESALSLVLSVKDGMTCNVCFDPCEFLRLSL